MEYLLREIPNIMDDWVKIEWKTPMDAMKKQFKWKRIKRILCREPVKYVLVYNKNWNRKLFYNITYK